jgi:hypothetical protein
MYIYDLTVFPREHHTKLKDMVHDAAEACRMHDEAYQELLSFHVIHPELSKNMDDQTFKVVELYRAILDCVNAYSNYLVANDLIKYLKNG